MNRREFAKGIGIASIAAATLVPAGIAKASASPFQEDEFDLVMKNFNPMRVADSNLIFGKNEIKFYKNKKNLFRDKYISLNGMAGSVVMLCRGLNGLDDISSAVGEIYGLPIISAKYKVSAFLKYLYCEGYICFTSENSLSVAEKRRGGLIVRNKREREIKVFQNCGEHVNITY